MVLAIFVSSALFWLIDNWLHDNVIRSVEIVKTFIHKNSIIVKFTITALILFFFEISSHIVKYYQSGKIANASGMFHYSSNHNKYSKRKSDNFLKEKGIISTNLCILCATGWETFGAEDSPLHQSVLNSEETKIIIACPQSEAVQKRAEDIGIKVNDYINDIHKSIKFLAELYEKGCNITVKMYQKAPLWKFIILDQYAWVQQYPRKEHVQDSPCYAVERLAPYGKRAMYSQVYNQFRRRWGSNYIGTYNFETQIVDFNIKNADGKEMKVKCIN